MVANLRWRYRVLGSEHGAIEDSFGEGLFKTHPLLPDDPKHRLASKVSSFFLTGRAALASEKESVIVAGNQCADTFDLYSSS
ncbi:hypothetical protein TNCV_740461 [Trichonephila clavipes]|nr:hypothetical protein TNCV_740461 [Trichonephila clavipes]